MSFKQIYFTYRLFIYLHIVKCFEVLLSNTNSSV